MDNFHPAHSGFWVEKNGRRGGNPKSPLAWARDTSLSRSHLQIPFPFSLPKFHFGGAFNYSWAEPVAVLTPPEKRTSLHLLEYQGSQKSEEEEGVWVPLLSYLIRHRNLHNQIHLKVPHQIPSYLYISNKKEGAPRVSPRLPPATEPLFTQRQFHGLLYDLGVRSWGVPPVSHQTVQLSQGV